MSCTRLSVCQGERESGSVEVGETWGPSLTAKCAFAFLTAVTPGGDTGATGGTRTALHLQLAGMLVHREFFQIHKTSRRGGESAKAKREGGRSKSGQAKRRPEQRRQRCPQGLSRPAPSHTACARAGPSRPPSLPVFFLSFLPSGKMSRSCVGKRGKLHVTKNTTRSPRT